MLFGGWDMRMMDILSELFGFSASLSLNDSWIPDLPSNGGGRNSV